MPRRSGGGGGGGYRARPAARSPVSNVPARAPPAAPAPPAAAAPSAVGQPRQPGMFAQMATTAAGVAVGSAIGHTVAGSMMGGGGRGEQQEQLAPAAPTAAYPQQQQQMEGGPCQLQMKQFLECAQTQHDITLCQGFNEALRECKMSYGING